MFGCSWVHVVTPLMGTAEVDDSELYASAVAREEGELTAGGEWIWFSFSLIFWILEREKAGLVGWNRIGQVLLGSTSCKTVGGAEGASSDTGSLFFPLAFHFPFLSPFLSAICPVPKPQRRRER